MQDVTELFGLSAPVSEEEASNQKDSADLHPESTNDGALVMTQYEYDLLQEAYETTMSRTEKRKSSDRKSTSNTGSYEPLTVTITHI